MLWFFFVADSQLNDVVSTGQLEGGCCYLLVVVAALRASLVDATSTGTRKPTRNQDAHGKGATNCTDGARSLCS